MNPMKRFAPAALLAAVALVVGCTPGPVNTPTPTNSTPAPTITSTPPTPTSSPSPSPSSTLSPEQEAAQAAAVEYFRVLNELRSNPDADFQQMADITTGAFTSAVAELLNNYRSDGVVQVGENMYTYTNIGPVVETDGVRSVEVRVCGDSRKSDLVDADGKSVLEPDRKGLVDYRLDIIEVGDSWRVNGGQSEAVESC